MSLDTDELIVIVVGSVFFSIWLLLFLVSPKYRNPLVSLLTFLIVGLLAAVFYGVREDKDQLWWIIPTTLIVLCFIWIVYLSVDRLKEKPSLIVRNDVFLGKTESEPFNHRE